MHTHTHTHTCTHTHTQVVYQKILQLSYVDKLIDQVHLAFRDKYKNELDSGPFRRMNFGADFEVEGEMI